MVESNKTPAATASAPGTYRAPFSFKQLRCGYLQSDFRWHHYTKLAFIKVSSNFHLSNTNNHFFSFVLLDSLAGFYIVDDLMTPTLKTLFFCVLRHSAFFSSFPFHFFLWFLFHSFFAISPLSLWPVYIGVLQDSVLRLLFFLFILILFVFKYTLFKNSYFISLAKLLPWTPNSHVDLPI